MITSQHTMQFAQDELKMFLPDLISHVRLSTLSHVQAPVMTVGGEIGRRIDITVKNNLLAIDVDRDFIKPFINKMDPGNEKGPGYVGIGKLIDASARFAAWSGDKRVLDFKHHLVRGLIDARDPDGYIGMMAPGNRMGTLWDIHEMSYIIYGLVSDYRLFREASSLDAAKKTADYMIDHWKALPERWPGVVCGMLGNLGLDRALIALSDASGNERYLRFCIDTLGIPDWRQKIVTGRVIEGQGTGEGHVYAYLTRCLAQLDLYDKTGDKKLLSASYAAIDFLTKNDGLLITGATGYYECWNDSQLGFFHVGETCATAYLIRLLDRLMMIDGNSRYGDLMERAIYNALFAAQSPDGRLLRYYAPFDGERVYFDKDTYCCPNNYRRIIAELPEMIYYRSGTGIAVNLYTPSKMTVKLTDKLGVTFLQETDYPSTEIVAIQVEPSQAAKFPLKLRIPGWCPEAEITVNGEKFGATVQAGKFFTVDRLWKSGDRITLKMPMNWRFIRGVKAQVGRAAVMRGPVLYCFDPARNPNMNGSELRHLRLDIGTLPVLLSDNAIRPGGTACRVKLWSQSRYLGGPDLEAVLTEFPDPSGRWTYFLLPDPNSGRVVKDELYE